MKRMLKKCLKKVIKTQTTKKLLKTLNSKFTKKSGSWYSKHNSDPYVKKSKKMNYRSRAAFKLLEIDQKYNILNKTNKNILDLGAAPGSWSQVLQKTCEKDTKILGLDLDPINNLVFIPNAPKINFLKGDITQRETIKKIMKYFDYEKIDLIICDISPNITGNRSVDTSNIIELNIKIIEQCDLLLKKNGNLLIKSFQSYLDDDLFFNFNLNFGKIIKIKPSSSKKESNEIFYYCKGYKKTFYWDLITKKGDKLTYQEMFVAIEKKTGFVMDKNTVEKMKESMKIRFYEGNLKEEDLRYKFQKDFFEEAKLVDIEKVNKKLCLEDIENNIEKFKKEFPDSKYLEKIENLPKNDKEIFEKIKKENEKKKKKI